MRSLALLVLLGCRPSQGASAVVAPVGTQVAALVKNRASASGALRVLDIDSGVLTSTDTGLAATSVAVFQGGYYVTSERPSRLFGGGITFSLTGFVPSQVSGGANALLVISRDVSSTSRIAVWEPLVGSAKRVELLGDTVPVSACSLDEGRWLVLGASAGAVAASEQVAIVSDAGSRDAQVSVESLTTSPSTELLGIAGCVTNGETVAVLFGESRNVLLLRLAGDVLIPTGVVALPGDVTLYDRSAPVFVNGSVVVATRADELLLLPVAGGPTTRLPFAGTPRVLARMVDALLVGTSTGLVLHSFDGSDDIRLLELGADEEIVDVVVTAPQGN